MLTSRFLEDPYLHRRVGLAAVALLVATPLALGWHGSRASSGTAITPQEHQRDLSQLSTYEARAARSGFRETGVSRFFLARAWFHPEGLNFGRRRPEVDALVDRVCTTMYRSDRVAHVPGRSVEATAGVIRATVDETFEEIGTNPSELLREWLYAEAVCAWVLSHAYYQDGRGAGEAWSARYSLSRVRPGGVCRDHAALAAGLAGALGLRCNAVSGMLCSPDASGYGAHAWVEFTFQVGNSLKVVPADVTSPLHDVDELPRWERKFRPAWTLPRTAEAVELFYAYHLRDRAPSGSSIPDGEYRRLQQEAAASEPQRRAVLPLWHWYERVYAADRNWARDDGRPYSSAQAHSCWCVHKRRTRPAPAS
jgi:hypothetical protein